MSPMLLFILLGIVVLASNSESIASPARLPPVSANRTILQNSSTDNKISSSTSSTSSNSSGSDEKVPSINANSQRIDKKLSFEPELLDTNFHPTPSSDSVLEPVESGNEQTPETNPLKILENTEKPDPETNEPDPDLSKPLSPFQLSTIKQEEINNESENFILDDRTKEPNAHIDIDGEAMAKEPNLIQSQNTQNPNVQNQVVLNNLNQYQNQDHQYSHSLPDSVKNISLLQTALNKILKEERNTSLVSLLDPSALWSTIYSGGDTSSSSSPEATSGTSLLSRLDYFNLGQYVDLKMLWLVPLVFTGLTTVLVVGLIYLYYTSYSSFSLPLSLLSYLPSLLEQPLEKHSFELSVLKALYDPQSFMGSNFRRF